MAIAKAPSSSDLASTLARDWALQVNTGTKDSAKWVFVRGLSQFAPEVKPKMQDDSDIDSEGYNSQIATALEMAFKGEGKRKGTDTEGTFKQDPGQAFIREAGRKMGLKNVIQARAWRTDGVQEGYEAHFSVEWEEKAGKNDDLDEFSFTMMSRGKPLEIKPVENPTGASVSADAQESGAV
ncbi:phage tail tube protein [Corynebacterium auriscanis]|uniref:phage tail tube protein n=1 Tax=Corynebacterium auriscanis TaxID=99807 RepID=UPI003CF2C891